MIDHAHPRPWHQGSLFTAGPRRQLGIGERALWLARLHAALAARQLSAAQYLVGRAMERLLGQDGRLDPSQGYLAQLAACSRRTAQRALERLQGLGLVRWVRRLVRAGWRAEQTSNAYELVNRATTPETAAVARPGRARHPTGVGKVSDGCGIGAACERQAGAEPQFSDLEREQARKTLARISAARVELLRKRVAPVGATAPSPLGLRPWLPR